LKILALFLASFLLCQCQNLYYAENPFTHYKRQKIFFSKITNDSNKNQSKVRVLYNAEYPINLTLYNDASFKYELEVLGDGWGTWEYTNGFLALSAERKRFVMKMQIHSISEDSADVSLVFADRFGQKFLPMTLTKI